MLYVKFLVILFNIAYILIHFLYTLIKCYKLNSSIFRKKLLEGWQSLAECTGLENQQGFTPFGGSNPSPSAP